ncbi:hypothetical protein N9849_00160 [bacterium]|nr:hypothetical protein [Akkermansiaceae bacterium]MDB4262397.1 hypothetical protein [bacterium]
MKAMISFRNLFLMLLTGVFFVSCAPYPPEGPPKIAEKVPAGPSANPEEKKPQTEAQKQAEANRQRLAAKKQAAQKNESTTAKLPVVEPKKSKYPTASATRKGFVKNPYTGNEVDVRGIPGGRLVVDPEDPNKSTNKFRVP